MFSASPYNNSYKVGTSLGFHFLSTPSTHPPKGIVLFIIVCKLLVLSKKSYLFEITAVQSHVAVQCRNIFEFTMAKVAFDWFALGLILVAIFGVLRGCIARRIVGGASVGALKQFETYKCTFLSGRFEIQGTING